MLKGLFAGACLLAIASTVRAADAPDTSSWAKFSAFHYSGTMPATAKPGDYLNPIIAGFHPDPSICRVGDDYYLVNSAFNYFPGIPIFHSRDLINWTQIGNVLDRPSQFPMSGGAMDRGTYAPTIRYHDGTFYMVNTLVGSGLGNYYVTAKDPKGPWSDPIKLDGVGGIDPDFFWDDDGKAYVTSCDDPPRGTSTYNGQRAITLHEMDFAAKKIVGDPTIIINGGTDITKRPSWCEGPHIYKISGKYYAMCAQGGTSTAHTEVIFKSDALRGPYVPWDKNPILTQMDLPNGRPGMVTSTGHADLVETQNHEWYAVFLGCQPYQGNFFNTGRETFMLPVNWTADGWPVILPPRTPVPLSVKKPSVPADKPASVATTGTIDYVDNFDGDALDFRWVQIRAPQPQPWFAISKSDKALFLEPRAEGLTSNSSSPSCLLTRQQNNDFTATVTLTAQPTTADCVAGLTAFMNETHFYAINAKIDAGHITEVSLEQPAAGGRGGRGRRGGGGAGAEPPAAAPATAPLAAQKIPDNTSSVQLKIEGAGAVTRLYCKVGDGAFTQVGGDLNSTFLSTDTAGGFQGVMLGVFAHK